MSAADDVFLALMVFFSAFLMDCLWAIYIRDVAVSRPLSSAWASLSIAVMGGLNVVWYVRAPWLIGPAAVGAFVGTYFTVRLRAKQKPK